MKLKWQENAICIGPRVKLKKNTFQGVVCQLTDPCHVDQIIQFIRQQPRFRHSKRFPRAYRVRKPKELDGANDNNNNDATSEDFDGKKPRGHGLVRNVDDIEEFEMDEKEPLLGGKLLHLLQQWQVEGILLMVARTDDSLSGLLIGGELYKLYVESAKLALEEFYITHLLPAPAVSFELQVSSPTSARIAQPPTVTKVVLSTEMIPTRKSSNQNQYQQLPPQQPRELAPHHKDIQPTDWLGISRDEYADMRRVRIPTHEFHLLMVCLAILLKRDDFSWNSCRQILQSKQLSSQLRQISVRTLTKNQVSSIRTILQEPTMSYHAFLRISTAIAKIYAWIARLLDEFDENQLGLQSAPQDILITNSTSSGSSATIKMPSPVQSSGVAKTRSPRGNASSPKHSETSPAGIKPHPPSTPATMSSSSSGHTDAPPPSTLRSRSMIIDHGRMILPHHK